MMVKLFCIGRNNVDVFTDEGTVYPGGNCSNVAANALRLGHRAAVLTTVGNDVLGSLQLESLKTLGVDVSLSHVEDDQTGWCMIRHDGNDRKFVRSDIGIFHRHPITRQDADQIAQSGSDLIYTCADSPFEANVFETLNAYGLPVCCDFTAVWDPQQVLAACRYIQYVYLSCERCTGQETLDLLKNCVQAGAVLAVGTHGMEGSLAYDGERFYSQDAYRVPIVDTLGAGDAFLAAFTCSYFSAQKEVERWLARLPACEARAQARCDMRQRVLAYSLNFAALYATDVCREKGGYGCGIPFKEQMIARSMRKIGE